MSDWYIGPLGDLRRLVVPEPDIKIDLVRFGGIHQGLSGARTMDITGYRTEYNFEFRNLERSEFMWLEALHSRFVDGPHRLIDPLKKNRLSAQASKMRTVDPGSNGVYTTLASSGSRDYPAAVPLPGRSLVVVPDATSVIQFDSGKRFPVLSAETPISSVWLRSASAYGQAYLRMSWYDIEDTFISNQDIGIDISVSWSRHWFNFVDKPVGAVAATFSVVLETPAIEVKLAAPQVEISATSLPTSFEIGGGAPAVLVDQLPAVSGRFPLRHATLTLLEA